MVRSVRNLSAPLATAVEIMPTNGKIDSIGAGEGDSTHGYDVGDGF